MNLVSMAMQYLAPVIINKIAASLGLGQGLVGKAISAALPAILAGLAGSASKSGGAGALAGILGKQDPGLLGNLGNLIGGGGQQQLVDSGTSALSSLLGGSQTNALASAVGKFAGLDAGKSVTLMGMLAPVILGTLAKEQKSSRLDAAGLANLLNGQKSNIAAAMPAGFSDLLQGSGVLDSISGNLKAAAPVAHAAPASSGSGLPSWLLPLVLGLAGLYLLSSYGCNQAPMVEKTAPPPAKTEAPAAAPKAEAPAATQVDVVGLASKALSSLTGTLGTVKDEATAKAAIPALTDTAKQIEAVKAAAGLLTGAARKPLTMLVGGALPGILAAIEKATGIPGAGAILKPIVEPMVANLTSLSK